MKTILLAALCAASCAPSRTTMARYPNAAPTFDRAKSDPKAVEIADKVVAAAGGIDKWNAVKQIRWSLTITNDGKVVFDGEEGWDRWNARAYGRLIQTQGDVVIRREIYGDGYDAEAELPGNKKQKLEPKEAPAAVKLATERWQFDSMVLCAPFLLEEVGSHLDYVGKAQGETGPLEVLKLTFDPADKARAGTSYQIDIDPTTFAVSRVEIIKPDGNIGYKATGVTEVNGMKFPTVQTNIGLPGEVFTYKKIATGDVEDSLYQLSF
jgi:hypothetical protein